MFFRDYTEKVWGLHPSKISASWGAQRIKGLSLLNIKAGSLDAEVVSELILSGAAYEIIESKRKIAKEANTIFDKIFKKNSLNREAKKDGLYPFFRTLGLPSSTLSGPEIEG